MQTFSREILICQTADGKEPVTEWLGSLDARTRAIIRVRIDRLEDGNFGDAEPVGEGVSELRIDFGAGYRVYFAQLGTEVHLLTGGSKRTQRRDITFAKKFWRGHD